MLDGQWSSYLLARSCPSEFPLSASFRLAPLARIVNLWLNSGSSSLDDLFKRSGILTYSKDFSTFFTQRVQDDEGVDLVSVLIEMCDLFGWMNATYLGSGLKGLDLGEDILITTYEKSWIDQYNTQNYKYIDPVVSIGTRSLLPLDWSELHGSDPILKAFFEEAKEAGVGSSGLTVAVRGLYGDSSLFSVTSSEKGEIWQLQKADLLPDLTYLAHLFHNVVVSRQPSNASEDRPVLSRREQDVLRWAAKGKTAWETGKILQIKEKTVSFYIAKASFKLNVATKTHAVAKAISEKLLIM